MDRTKLTEGQKCEMDLRRMVDKLHQENRAREHARHLRMAAGIGRDGDRPMSMTTNLTNEKPFEE